MELQALPSRIGQVRRIVSAQLRYWHMDPLIDRAALGVTELLSNVHRHARPDKSCTVELELLPDRLTVSVRDHDPRLPVPADAPGTADATPLATCGRGLAMVAAVSESWGARPDGENGKVVWFTLPASAAPRSTPERPPRDTTRPTPVRAGAGVGAGTPVAAGAGSPVPVVVGVANGAALAARASVGAGAVADGGAVGEAGGARPVGSTAGVGRTAPVPGRGPAPARTGVPAGSPASAPAGRTAPAPAGSTAPVTAPAPAARPASPGTGTPPPARPAVHS